MPDVFISYRREDSGSAGRLGDWLASHFGAESVFVDVTGIGGGEEFPAVIEEAIRGCQAFLAVITPRWGDGLSDPNDWIRRELSLALGAGKQVVPVLIDGAEPPDRTALPADLEPLADRNAVTLSAAGYASDVGRLIEGLERIGVAPAAIGRPLPEVTLSDRCETRDAWSAPDDPQHARERVIAVLAGHGIRLSSEVGGDLRLAGGSKWKARVLGALFGSETRLPSQGVVRIRDRGATVTVEVLLAEDFGPGVLAGVQGRYESLFGKVIADLRKATGRR
jgi:hypothetical protein